MALACLLGAALACALPGGDPSLPSPLPPSESPAPGGAPPTPRPFSGTAVSGAGESLPPADRFAPFSPAAEETLPESSELPPAGDVDKQALSEILDEAQQEQLLAQGFLIVPRPFDSFQAVYSYGADEKLPAYITPDPVLHSLQVLSDVTWQRSQRQFLAGDLQGLSEVLVRVSQEQWEAAASDDLPGRAAWRNMAFFAVGSSLLDPDFTPPPPVADVINEELTLIESGGRFVSPLFGVEQDYDRYQPRSYYAGDETLSRYYRAMAWYGQTLALDVEDIDVGRMSAAQALLAAWAVTTSDNLSRWERVYEPTLYFRGSAGARSLPEVLAAAESVYGSQRGPEALRDVLRLDDLIATLRALPPPASFDLQPAPAFAFMPAAREIDAPILRDVVFNRVGAYEGAEAPGATGLQTNIGVIRGLPRALDIPAAFGSEAALARIEAAGDAAYEGYQIQMDTLRQHFAQMAPTEWSRTTGGAWTFALQPLLAEDGRAWPPSAPLEGWQDRSFNTWYGAWVEMRHDTRLTPRPVTAAAQPPDAAIGYLEPHVLLYGRLASLVEQIADGLGARGLLEEESGEKMEQMARVLRGLEVISRKELKGERLTADESLLMSQLVVRLSNLTTFEPPGEGAPPLTDVALPRLVDVALEPGSGKLLQAAIGEAWPVYALVPHEERMVPALGAVYSTYELIGEQIPDGAWQEMESRPQPPPWMAPYLASPQAR